MNDDVMNLVRVPLLTTEDQALIAESARQVVRSHAPISRFRTLRERVDPYGPRFWAFSRRSVRDQAGVLDGRSIHRETLA